MILTFTSFLRMTLLQNEIKLPCNHWGLLSSEDQSAFRQLHVHFIQQQKDHIKDRRNNCFFNDILCLMNFIDYSSIRRDDRAICVGLAFSGPFVCVNTQQLKTILGRCKSSINNSFQQIGYDAVKNKSKSKEAVLAIIPSLIAEQNTLRKWTVRCASETANCCFYSIYHTPQLPFISDEDLYDDKKSVQGSMMIFTQTQSNQNSNVTPPISPINNLNLPEIELQQTQISQTQNASSISQQPNLFQNNSAIFQQSQLQQHTNYFSQMPISSATNFSSQASVSSNNNNQSQNQPYILPPINFSNGNLNVNSSTNFTVLPPMNFNQSPVPSPSSISITTSPTSPAPPNEFQFKKLEETYLHNPNENFDFESNVIADNSLIQSQQLFMKKDKHQPQQYDLSLYGDEEMPIPDITPSFSMNYLTEFGDNDDFNFDFDVSDSIVNPSKSSVVNGINVNINIARSQSAFISSFGDLY